MKNRAGFVVAWCLILFFLGFRVPVAQAAADPYTEEMASTSESNGMEAISDPLEPMNRFFFEFNDRLYFWVLKPVSTGYSYVVAEDVRMSIRDFFYNLLAPVRIVNSLLQGKVKNSATELGRFVINSTVGVVGFGDPATNEFGLPRRDEDLGQTLGVYGIGDGFYICWPILGPSSLRDTVGLVGDSFLDPVSYLMAADFAAGAAVYSGSEVNKTSLTLGDYEEFKEAAFDPYLALRDAYQQYRRNKIKDGNGAPDSSLYKEKRDED